MRKQEIVFVLDNTVFNIAARITSLDLIRSISVLCGEILVPESVFNELLSFDKSPANEFRIQTQKYISWVEETRYKIRLCNTRDEIIFQQLKNMKNIDGGEADAVAQISKISLNSSKYFVFCSDDKKCTSALENYSYINCVSSLFLIFMLDIQGFLTPDYDTVMKEYLSFTAFPKKEGVKIIKQEYSKVMRFYDIPPDKKLLKQKTGVLSKK
jgi:predicted nucleic acid-binding protein